MSSVPKPCCLLYTAYIVILTGMEPHKWCHIYNIIDINSVHYTQHTCCTIYFNTEDVRGTMWHSNKDKYTQIWVKNGQTQLLDWIFKLNF